MDAVGYARVSTAEQADFGLSLSAQTEKIRAYCAALDLRLIDLIAADESAKSLHRFGLQSVCDLLESGAATCLVIAKLDRLTRDVGDWQTLYKRYFDPKSRKHLCSASELIDLTTANGRLVVNLLMSVAQHERESIVERTTQALGQRHLRGDRTGSIPYGFTLDPESRRNKNGRPTGLLKSPEEQKVIERIKIRHASGWKPRAIAEELSRLRIPTKSGNATWGHSSVARILSRKPVLKGQGP